MHQTALERLALEEPAAFRHEHGRLYNALEHAAQIAELADHDDLARILRRERRAVAAELAADRQHAALHPLRLDPAETAALTHHALRLEDEVADG